MKEMGDVTKDMEGYELLQSLREKKWDFSHLFGENEATEGDESTINDPTLKEVWGDPLGMSEI